MLVACLLSSVASGSGSGYSGYLFSIPGPGPGPGHTWAASSNQGGPVYFLCCRGFSNSRGAGQFWVLWNIFIAFFDVNFRPSASAGGKNNEKYGKLRKFSKISLVELSFSLILESGY